MLKCFIQKSFIGFILATLAFSPLLANPDYLIEDQPLVIEKCIQFEQKGILKQTKNGYLYLDISNDFIGEVLPLIEVQGKIIPPSYYKSKKGIGAHISVMHKDEQILNEIWEIKELGQLSRDQDVTLLCHCIGVDKHCHRFVIRALVEKGN